MTAYICGKGREREKERERERERRRKIKNCARMLLGYSSQNN